jgi:hypothetical protein
VIKLEINVPKELTHSLFFPKGKIKMNSGEALNSDVLFLPELLYFSRMSDDTPWDDPITRVPLLVDKWTVLQKKLITLLKKRTNDIESDMLLGIQLCFTLLFWSNKQPVQLFEWQEKIRLLEAKAINVEERLQFILSNYRTFHAYKQLAELIEEQHKQFARKIAIEKYKSKKVL